MLLCQLGARFTISIFASNFQKVINFDRSKKLFLEINFFLRQTLTNFSHLFLKAARKLFFLRSIAFQCSNVCFYIYSPGKPEDFLFLKEVITNPGLRFVERPHDQYSSAIYVKPGLDVNNTNIYIDNNMEIVSIDLEGLTVTSIYKPPKTPFTYKDLLLINLLKS